MTLALHPRVLPTFTSWIVSRGAQVLATTNEYEMLRFKTDTGTGVVYRNKHFRLKLVGEAPVAFEAFRKGLPWRATPAVPRVRRSADEQTLRLRDGDLCFFCQKDLGDDATVEHLVARTHSGPNHISNKVLAHKICNADVGHMSAMEKIRIHTQALLSKL